MKKYNRNIQGMNDITLYASHEYATALAEYALYFQLLLMFHKKNKAFPIQKVGAELKYDMRCKGYEIQQLGFYGKKNSILFLEITFRYTARIYA